MPNPQIPLGTLNKLNVGIYYAQNLTLNVTPSFLTKESISIAFENDASKLIPAMTGGVKSPEPYQLARVTASVLKTNGLAQIYKDQIETNTDIGDLTVVTDTVALRSYDLVNCVLLGVEDITFDGEDAGMRIKLQGTYYVNNLAFA